ncbi:MAG: shikimate dehydrogenase [Peptococcaceae bacterium]|nr:shikimate dehydrogenase [Peptococcaceae bacterium]
MNLKYAIIGDPVEHSLSPVMHEAGFKYLNMNASYHRIRVSCSELKGGLDFLKKNNYSGWNVTYPLKEKIVPFLDHLTSSASLIGAVNTVKSVSGQLHGHNTDGEGLVESLVTKGYDLKNKKVVILGAGGAAKAITFALASRDLEIIILNRSVKKAENLAKQVAGLGGKASFGILARGSWLKEVDLLIQTTPVGMNGEDFLFDLQGIKYGSLAIDLIYNPYITSFLAQAQSYGCKTMNGLEMLLYQGILAWKYWFAIEAPVEIMRRSITVLYEG